jgi:hypothetical protein
MVHNGWWLVDGEIDGDGMQGWLAVYFPFPSLHFGVTVVSEVL